MNSLGRMLVLTIEMAKDVKQCYSTVILNNSLFKVYSKFVRIVHSNY